MLKFLRNKKTAKKVWIGLAIIIIPAFAFWGFGGISDSRKDNTVVGKIFGHSVSNLEFQESLAAVRTNAILQFGDQLPEIEKYLNLESQAWDRLVLLQKASQRKITVTDQEVIKTIQDAPYFQNKKVFDNKTYLTVLRYVFRTQPRMFEDQTRKSLILTKLYHQITDQIKLSDEEIRQNYLKANQELRIDYIASLFADFSKNLKISEQEINTYFEKNKTMFKEMPKINVTFISTDSDAIAKKISLLAKQNYSLDKISAELKIAKKETGILNPSNPPDNLELPQGILSLISNQKIQALAPLIKSGNSSYLCSLKERIEARIPELKEVKTKVKETLAKELAKNTAENKINDCAKKLKKLTFSKAAKNSGLKSKLSPYFKSSGLIPGLGQANIFWENAIKLKPNETSSVFSDANGFYIIKLNDLKPIEEGKFLKEKVEFGQKLTDQKKSEAFTKFTEEAKKKAQ